LSSIDGPGMYWNDAPKRPVGVGMAVVVLAAVLIVVVVWVAAGFGVAGKLDDNVRDS